MTQEPFLTLSNLIIRNPSSPHCTGQTNDLLISQGIVWAVFEILRRPQMANHLIKNWFSDRVKQAAQELNFCIVV